MQVTVFNVTNGPLAQEFDELFREHYPLVYRAATRSDGFDVEALIPEGTPSYASGLFNSGRAPELALMLQTLLAERFKLEMHAEMRETAVFELTVARGGQKLTPWKDGDREVGGNGIRPGGIQGFKRSMKNLTNMLGQVVGRPVVDRTGITGEFNYLVQWEPLVRIPGEPVRFDLMAEPQVVSDAIERELGLRLDAAKVPLEFWVIDRVEKPSEN